MNNISFPVPMGMASICPVTSEEMLKVKNADRGHNLSYLEQRSKNDLDLKQHNVLISYIQILLSIKQHNVLISYIQILYLVHDFFSETSTM